MKKPSKNTEDVQRHKYLGVMDAERLKNISKLNSCNAVKLTNSRVVKFTERHEKW